MSNRKNKIFFLIIYFSIRKKYWTNKNKNRLSKLNIIFYKFMSIYKKMRNLIIRMNNLNNNIKINLILKINKNNINNI
jgi:hypothetical protein